MRNVLLLLRGCAFHVLYEVYFPVVVASYVMLFAFADQVIAAIDPKKVEILQRYAPHLLKLHL